MKEYKGYTYTKDGTSDNLQKTYYKCSAYYALKCRARLCEYDCGIIQETGQEHTCREFEAPAPAGPSHVQPPSSPYSPREETRHFTKAPTHRDGVRIRHHGYIYRKTATSRYQKVGDTEAPVVWYYKCVNDCPGGIKRNADGRFEVTKQHVPECSKRPHGPSKQQASPRADGAQKTYNYKGYRYRVNKYGQNGEISYRCADYRNSGCVGRIIVAGKRTIVRKQHTCASGRQPSSVEENVAGVKSYKGYSYRKDSEGERGQVYYRCAAYRKTGCLARIKVIGYVTRESGKHQHTCREGQPAITDYSDPAVKQNKERTPVFDLFHGDMPNIGHKRDHLGVVRSGVTPKPPPSATATTRCFSAIPSTSTGSGSLQDRFQPIKSLISFQRSNDIAFIPQAQASLAPLPTVVEQPTGMGTSRDGEEILSTENEIMDLDEDSQFADGDLDTENAKEGNDEGGTDESFGSQLQVGVVSEDDGDAGYEGERNQNSVGDREGGGDEDGNEDIDGDGEEEEEEDANSEYSEDVESGDSAGWVAENDGDEPVQEEETNSRGEFDSEDESWDEEDEDEDANAQSHGEDAEQAGHGRDETSGDLHTNAGDAHTNIDIEAMENSDNDGDDGVHTPNDLNDQHTTTSQITPNNATSPKSQNSKSKAAPKSRQTQSPQITQSSMGFEASAHAPRATYSPRQTRGTQTPKPPETRETPTPEPPQERGTQPRQLIPQTRETQPQLIPQTRETQPERIPQTREIHQPQARETQTRRSPTPQLPQSSMPTENAADALWLRNLGHRVSEIRDERRRKRLKLDLDEMVLRAQREDISDD